MKKRYKLIQGTEQKAIQPNLFLELDFSSIFSLYDVININNIEEWNISRLEKLVLFLKEHPIEKEISFYFQKWNKNVFFLKNELSFECELIFENSSNFSFDFTNYEDIIFAYNNFDTFYKQLNNSTFETGNTFYKIFKTNSRTNIISDKEIALLSLIKKTKK